ncbi:helix-turn-helix domain-containing protein [Niallia sp. 03133]|uniref:helix-turn-helix domain-containing protein n=1 Tax=Niallia sp. 03133 TaxID=3458060 RepID=UPI004044079B
MSELGNRLKEARLAKGLSLEELQEMTKIQKRYLVGIEEGNHSMMPGKFYARAFIKQYAEAVDLAPEELFEEFKEEVPSTINDEIPEQLSRVTSRKTMAIGSSKVFDILPTIFIILLVIGIFFLVWYFVFAKGNDSDTAPKPNKSSEANYQESEKLKENKEKEDKADKNNTEENNSKNEEQAKEEEEAPKQEVSVVKTAGRTTEYELKNTDKFELKVVSTGETWINIKNGKGYSFFQGILKKGETESKSVDFSKETEAVIVIGNSAQTEIYVNDEKVDFAVSPATSVRQDITIRNNK